MQHKCFSLLIYSVVANTCLKNGKADSDEHIHLFHDSPGFTKVHVDSIQFNSFMMSFQKGLNHDSQKRIAAQKVQLKFNSPMIGDFRFDSIPFNKNTIQLIYDVSTLTSSILVISYVTLLGLLPKSRTFLSVMQ